MGVQGHKEHLHDALLADRKWDAQVAEGVEGHGDLEALGADERGLEEAVKRVHDHRVVAPPVVTPRLIGHFLRDGKRDSHRVDPNTSNPRVWSEPLGVGGAAHLVRASFGVPQFDVLFVLDPVQVFVQPVQQEGEQLLTVVLLVAQELGGKVAHLGLHTHTHTYI